MSRKGEQADLIFKLGQLLGPALKVEESPDQYDSDESTRIMARLFADIPIFITGFQRFCYGEPGHKYQIQYQHGFSVMDYLGRPKIPFDDEGRIQRAALTLQEIILSIPVPIDSTIHEARTPFSTYCFVKDLCSTVKQRIVWLDQYFDHTVFHRYFRDIASSVQITLVTSPAAGFSGRADVQRIREFMDISKTFALERGPQGYRLIENSNFHDRWLMSDDRLFVLGGSIKDLAKPFTVSKLDSTPDSVKHFDEAILNGMEIFGPSQTVHP